MDLPAHLVVLLKGTDFANQIVISNSSEQVVPVDLPAHLVVLLKETDFAQQINLKLPSQYPQQ